MSQKKQLLVGLVVALVVVAGLGTYAFLGVFKPDQAEAERKEAEAKLFSLEVEELTRLEVFAKDETTVLERQDGAWRITSPVLAAADEDAVRSLLDRLSRANRRKLLEEDGDPSLFGLDEPTLRISAQAASGEQAEVALGGQNSFDSSWFATIRPNQIITVDGWLKGSLEKSTFDLREKRLLDLGIDSVQQLHVTGLATYAISRSDDGWRRDDPDEVVEPAAVDEILLALRDLKATAFPAGAAETFGLDRPLLTVTLSREGQEPLTLRIARVGDQHHAQAEGGPVAEIPASIVDTLSEPPPRYEPPEEPEAEANQMVEEAAGAQEAGAD